MLSTSFDPAFASGGGAAFEEVSHRLNALDFHPSLGPSGYESSSVPESRDLPPRFVAGQESSSVLQITKRPKLRAKDVAHRQSLTAGDVPTAEPHFWNLDSSFVRPDYARSPPAGISLATPIGMGSVEGGRVGQWPAPTNTPAPVSGGPDGGVSFLVTLKFGARGVTTSATHSLPIRELRAIAAGCAARDEDSINLSWEGTLLSLDRTIGEYISCWRRRHGNEVLSWPLTQPVIIVVSVATPSPESRDFETVPAGHSPGSSIASGVPDYGPFSVTLVFEDGHIFLQPTWPTVNVRLLRRQVATSLNRVPESLFFVCHGSVLGLERRLSDHPAIGATTQIFVFFALDKALQVLGIHGGPPPPNSPPPTSPPPVHGPAFPPGFQRQSPSANPTIARTSNDKLRGTFKCPKFLGDARHWKNWNKGFVRFLAIQVLDHAVAEGFKALTSVHQEDNKLVYYVLEDAVSGSPVATKYVRRAPLWDGHAAYNFLYDGYSFSGPATATLLLSELSNFRFLADESVSELVLRLQEMFGDLEAVPGASSVVFGDTQKINYLLSAIWHERSMQPVYVQIQTDQLRGRITFEQACDDLRYRCETQRADELLGTTARTSKVRGLLTTGESPALPLCTIHSSTPPTTALITTANKRQNALRPKKEPTPCLAKGCASMAPSHVRLCRLHFHECVAGKQPQLPQRTGGVAHYDASTNKVVYPASASPSKVGTPAKPKVTVKAHVAFATSESDDSN